MSNPLGRAVVQAADRTVDLLLKQGTITDVDGRKCTVTVDGDSVPNVRALDHVALAQGVGCWLLFMGSGRWLIMGTTRDGGGPQPVGGLPAGTVADFIGTLPPPGWVLIVGQTLVDAETAHPELWANCPAALKSGSNIVLPDTRGRVSTGYDSGDTLFNLIGKLGGFRNAPIVAHNHNVGNHAHDSGNLGANIAHNHNINDHNHTIPHNHNLNAHTHNIGNSVETATAVRFSSASGFLQVGTGATGWWIGGRNIANDSSANTGNQVTNTTGNQNAHTTGNQVGNTTSVTGNTGNSTAVTANMVQATETATDRNFPPFVTFARMVYLG